jgi:phenylacetate-CoA ligase
VPIGPDIAPLLRDQLGHLATASEFYAERLGGRARTLADLPHLPLLTKADLRESQRRRPPLGEHLCVEAEQLVRIHVTSGTTGEPVAIGFTQADHQANSAIGGAAFRTAGVRRDHTIAHCLNYSLYAGGIADHMALEASGATVVPVGVGQTHRLLELIPRLGITAIFGTLSFPAHLAQRAQALGVDPRSLGMERIVTAGEPGAGLSALRGEIERVWGAAVTDTFGMSDVWSTMAGGCTESEGLHLTTEGHVLLEVVDPAGGEALPLEDGVRGELVWTHLRREASPLLRYRSADLGQVWTAPCACGRTSPRIRIDGRTDDMLRVQAVNVYPSAVGEILARHPALGRWAVVAAGDPIVPPLRVYVEADEPGERPDLAAELAHSLRSAFAVNTVPRGTVPVAEHKTQIVYRGKDPFA